MAYHPPYTQIGHFMGRETVYCNMNSNMVEGVGCSRCQVAQWAVKQSVYLCYYFRRFSKAGETEM